MDDIPEWDSFKHIELIIGLEQEFGIKLEYTDTTEMISIPIIKSKILKLLLKAKVLSSVRGAKGGYALVQTPEKITVASVITALEGPISLTECSSTDHSCEQVSACQIGNNWRVVNQKIQQA